MSDHDRLHRYVEGFFERHQKTEWPTMRCVAKALHWTYARIQDAIDGDPDGRMCLSSYFVAPEPSLGEHLVESLSE